MRGNCAALAAAALAHVALAQPLAPASATVASTGDGTAVVNFSPAATGSSPDGFETDIDETLPPVEHHRYVIVGAGPGGIQIAHFLHAVRADYIVLDQQPSAGSFFNYYPRWRQLISINKPFTGRSDSFDFNSRHDWNSLLSENPLEQGTALGPCPVIFSAGAGAAPTEPSPSSSCLHPTFSSTDAARDAASVDDALLFRHYTKDYYPEAGLLADYLNAWANGSLPVRENRPLNIRFNTRVENVRRPAGYIPKPSPTRDAGSAASASSSSASASGAIPFIPFAVGSEQDLPRLEEVSSGAARFLLTARELSYPSSSSSPSSTKTSDSGSIPGAGRVAGEGRTISATYIIWAGGLQEALVPHGRNSAEALEKGWIQRYDSASTDPALYVNKSVLLLGRGNAAFEFAHHVLGSAAYVHLLGQRRKRISQAIETHYPGDVRHVHSRLLETYLLKSMDGMGEVFMQHLTFGKVGDGGGKEGEGMPVDAGKITVTDSASASCTRDEYGRPTSRCFFRRPYDIVIACPGWKMARGSDLFPSPSVRPALFSNGKHPLITPRYESANVPGLFFAGNLGHAHDFKKSSGGFIHGFRYTARALFRELMEEQQVASVAAAKGGVGGPTEGPGAGAAAKAQATVVSPTGSPSALSSPASSSPHPGMGWPRRMHAGIRSATDAILRRINHAAGPYQMFGTVGDVFVLPPLAAEQAENFTEGGVGALAPFAEPWTFPPRGGGATNGTAEAASIIYHRNRPSSAQAPSASRRRSDSILDAAMTGWLFEEVPARLAEHKAPAWAAQLALAQAAAFEAAGGGDPSSLAARGAADTLRRSAAALSTRALGGLPAVGAEYIVLTLEFGTGAGPLPDGVAGADPARKASAVGGTVGGSAAEDVRARSELQRDPFSLLRANVGVHNPEASHFLHPVLRYFHTSMGKGPTGITGDGVGDESAGVGADSGGGGGMPAAPKVLGVGVPTPLYPGGPLPVAECHLVEDFWTDWTSHTIHVLPIARFLQEVAARRAAAALEAAKTARGEGGGGKMMAMMMGTGGGAGGRGTSGGPLPPPGPMGAVLHPMMAVQGSFALQRAWAADRPSAGPTTAAHAALLNLMADKDGTKIFFRGKGPLDGGQGWFHHLSMRSADEALTALGPQAFLVHLVDTNPAPLTAEEVEWTRAWAAEAAARRKADAMAPGAAPSASFTHIETPDRLAPGGEAVLTPELEARRAALDSRFEKQWRRVTSLHPGLVVVQTPCRAGPDREWANSMMRNAPMRAEAHCSAGEDDGGGWVLLYKDGDKNGVPRLPPDVGRLLPALAPLMKGRGRL